LEQLAGVLAELATKFGIAAEEVWPHVVYVTWLQAVTQAVGGAVALVVGLWLIRKAIGWYTRHDDTDMELASMISFAIGAVAIFFGCAAAMTSIPGLFDPLGVTVLNLLR